MVAELQHRVGAAGQLLAGLAPEGAQELMSVSGRGWGGGRRQRRRRRRRRRRPAGAATGRAAVAPPQRLHAGSGPCSCCSCNSCSKRWQRAAQPLARPCRPCRRRCSKQATRRPSNRTMTRQTPSSIPRTRCEGRQGGTGAGGAGAQDAWRCCGGMCVLRPGSPDHVQQQAPQIGHLVAAAAGALLDSRRCCRCRVDMTYHIQEGDGITLYKTQSTVGGQRPSPGVPPGAGAHAAGPALAPGRGRVAGPALQMGLPAAARCSAACSARARLRPPPLSPLPPLSATDLSSPAPPLPPRPPPTPPTPPHPTPPLSPTPGRPDPLAAAAGTGRHLHHGAAAGQPPGAGGRRGQRRCDGQVGPAAAAPGCTRMLPLARRPGSRRRARCCRRAPAGAAACGAACVRRADRHPHPHPHPAPAASLTASCASGC
jgi:hypothetical protein